MSLKRTLQRYLAFGPVVSAYYSLRCRADVSTRARVQLSSLITFGRGSVVEPFSVIKTTRGRITFGESCLIGCFAHINTNLADVFIGRGVEVGPYAVLGGSKRRFQDPSQPIRTQGFEQLGLRIGDGVRIGAGAVVLAGVELSPNVVIGEGAVVTEDVPANTFVSGIPARIRNEQA